MTRILQPEILDDLRAEDPRAIQSRRDLRRINALMGNARAITRFLKAETQNLHAFSPITVAELGAGDGDIARQVCRSLASGGVTGRLLLVDRAPAVSPQTIQSIQECGWSVEVLQADVFEWLPKAKKADVIIANLFLHHFDEARLRELFVACARLSHCFAAAEPRRTRAGEWFARKVWAIGCNDVTCHDAEVSVRAGFIDHELSALWPPGAVWEFVEKRAGLFNHFFGATRRS